MLGEGAPLSNEEEDKDVEVRCHARVSAGKSPSERSLHSCTLQTIEGCRVVYLYGGRSKSGTALDDMHVLDLEANFWSNPKPKNDKPAGRFGHCAVSWNEDLYVFGGQSKGQATFSFQEDMPKPSIFSDKKKGHRDAETEVCDELLAYHTPTSATPVPQTHGKHARQAAPTHDMRNRQPTPTHGTPPPASPRRVTPSTPPPPPPSPPSASWQWSGRR